MSSRVMRRSGVEGEFGLHGADDGLRTAEAVALAGEGEIGVRYAAPGDLGEEPVALHGRADHIVQALEQQERRGDPVSAVQRGALAVAVGTSA